MSARPDQLDPPLTGVRVVEVALGGTAVGSGLAARLPGRLLADLGASVVAVRSTTTPSLDDGLELARAWDRGKAIERVDTAALAATALRRLDDADVLVVSGAEDLVERAGLDAVGLSGRFPRLVHVRIRPGWDAAGEMADLELLVQARAGLLTQIRGHRPGPCAGALPIANVGAGLSATVGSLARLYDREVTGIGGWVETSLYDGLIGLLPMITGAVEHHSPATRLLWEQQGPAESLAYPCADGRYLQLWFGAKGAYEEFLEAMGDEPSEQGYQADLVSGAMVDRATRWAATLATKDLDAWVDELAGRAFRCEPVWKPGEALLDPHVREVGLAVDDDGGDATVLGPVLSVRRAEQAAGVGARSDRATPGSAPVTGGAARGPLSGVRVLDLSAYLAGPVAPLVLAELGADVVKVEPPTGDAHRGMHPMFAAGQRGKRALALDLKAPEAADVLDRLFRWSDVVHHNSRVGAAERLGYGEDTVRAANPDVVYSFASGFGEHGPRALLATNDQLLQALAGTEAAQGGAGNPPTYLAWGAIDVTGGWLAACGIVAGLYGRRRDGGGRSVASSLLGAALLHTSGAAVVGDRVEGGPVLDADQHGFGAAYRLYRGADDAWFALAVPDQEAWAALAAVVAGLPPSPPPLRTSVDAGAQPEEQALADTFATRPAGEWVADLRAAGVPVEPVPDADRTAFARGIVDDPVNRELGRVVTFAWGDLGQVSLPTLPPRVGPDPRPGAAAMIPALGEHTAEILDSI